MYSRSVLLLAGTLCSCVLVLILVTQFQHALVLIDGVCSAWACLGKPGWGQNSPICDAGIIIPPLPEKNAIQKYQMTSEFIEQRRQALQVYVNRVVSN